METGLETVSKNIILSFDPFRWKNKQNLEFML